MFFKTKPLYKKSSKLPKEVKAQKFRSLGCITKIHPLVLWLQAPVRVRFSVAKKCTDIITVSFFYQLKYEAENIFHNHLDANAPMPVNIDSNAVKDAEEQLQNPNNDMFRLQQQQV